MPVELEYITRNAGFIDTRIKINIMMLNLARRVGFPIRDGLRFINMIFQIGHFEEFYKMIEEVLLK